MVRRGKGRVTVKIPGVNTGSLATTAEETISQNGAEFRRLRTIRGECLEAIAYHLDVKAVYLFGMEQGDLSAIPGKRKTKRFLRVYADYLGLDGGDVIRKMKPIISNLPEEKAPSAIKTVGTFQLTSMIIVSVSLALGIATGWSYASKIFRFDLLPAPVETAVVVSSPMNDEVVAAERALARLKDQVTSSDVPTIENGAVAPQTAARQSVAGDRETTRRAAPADSKGRGGVAPRKEELPANFLATLLARRGDGARVYEPENVDARVIVRALKTVQVRVASESQDYSWSRTMQPKEMMLVPNRDDLELSTAHADGIEILLDGVILPPLGHSHTTSSGLPLSAPSLQAALTAARPDHRIKPTF